MDVCCKGAYSTASLGSASSTGVASASNLASNSSNAAMAANLARVAASSLAKNLLIPSATAQPPVAVNASVAGVTRLQTATAGGSMVGAAMGQHMSSATTGSLMHYNPVATLLQNGAAAYRHDLGAHAANTFAVPAGAHQAATAAAPGLSLIYPQVAAAAAAAYQVG